MFIYFAGVHVVVYFMLRTPLGTELLFLHRTTAFYADRKQIYQYSQSSQLIFFPKGTGCLEYY